MSSPGFKTPHAGQGSGQESRGPFPERAALRIAAVSLGLSLAYVLLVYPAWGQTLGANLDPDRWGDIGLSLWRNRTFAYYPETAPIIYRAPLYPFFLALVLALAGQHAWPQSVQIAQCLLFTGTCLLTYALGRELFGRRTAVLSALAVALHPMLIWYTSRFWVESLSAFLFTLLLHALLRCVRRGGTLHYAGAGVVLGLCILVKSTYLPFVCLVPACLVLAGGRAAAGKALLVGATACCLVAPWTVRNYVVTGAFIPVHVGAGVNLAIADCTVENFSRAPFVYLRLFDPCKAETMAHIATIVPSGASRSEQELAVERICLRERLDAYLRDPGFLLYKMGHNAVMFWVLSGSSAKSLVLALLQAPVLLLGVIGAVRSVRRTGCRAMPAVLLLLVLSFYLLHLPINAVARYSAVLLPVLLVFGASVLGRESASGAGRQTGRPSPPVA